MVHYSVPSTALSKGVKEGKGLKISALNKLLTRLITTNKRWEKLIQTKKRSQKNISGRAHCR